MGASTPHFALQLRNRIRKLIAPLPPEDPARRWASGDRAARAARLRGRDPRRRRAAGAAPAAEPRRGRADALRRGSDARLASAAGRPASDSRYGDALAPRPRRPRRPVRRVRRPLVPRAGQQLGDEHGEDDLTRELACGPPGLGAQAQTRNVPRSRRICTKAATPRGSRCVGLYGPGPMPRDLAHRARPARRDPRLGPERTVARRPVRGAPARPAARRSRACRSSARSSTCAPGRARVWFELRDERGALPCSMWRRGLRRARRPARRRPARGRRRRL